MLPPSTSPSQIRVAALYQFTEFPDPSLLRAPLLAVCQQAGAKGTLLLAPEGINGTIAAPEEGIDVVLDHIRTLPGCANIDIKFSTAATMPFNRLKVRLKTEIVTMGVPEINPARDAGTYVDPKEWNALIGEPGTIIIDTRNDYEVELGSFTGAVNPETANFGEFPAWFRDFSKELSPGTAPKIAMFCTGGIRCEKATAFVKAQGFEKVFHLRGGILKYLEEVNKEESRFDGECFLFDQRVSLGHGLEQGGHDMCGPCGSPISEEDKASPLYSPGLSCPNCHGKRTESQQKRYAERRKQLALELARKQAVRDKPPAIKSK